MKEYIQNSVSATRSVAMRIACRLTAALGLLAAITVHAQIPTTIVLTVSNNSPAYVTPAFGGSGTTLNPVMVTATVTVTATGQPVTGGSVTFYDNVGTANAVGPDAIGTGSIQYRIPGTFNPEDAVPGTAILPFAFGPGPHSLTASYSGTTGGPATDVFPATPAYAPATTAMATPLTSNGIAASSYAFTINGPGFIGRLGQYNPALYVNAYDPGFATNPSNTSSFVTGYGMQVPTGTSTLTDQTTGAVYPLTENTTFSQSNLMYQPTFATAYQGPGVLVGNFVNQINSVEVTSFFLADVLQGGVPQVVTVSAPQNNIWVTSLYGNTNYASVSVANNPVQAVAADLNGDGWQDLVVAHNDTSGTGASVGVVLDNYNPITNANALQFTAPETVYTLGHPISNVATGDLNGDGFPDIVAVTADGTNLIYVLVNDGEGNFTPTGIGYPAGIGASQVAVADFNGDGILDIAVLNTTDATIGILLGNGNGTFQSMAAYAVGTNPTAFSVADLNVDGYLDFAITNNDSPTQAEVSFLYGQTGGTFNYVANLALNQLPLAVLNYPETNPEPTVIQATDLNGDGYPDLFIGFNINQVMWALYVPATGQYVYQSEVYQDALNGINLRTASPGVADVDGDGVKDFMMMTTVNNLLPCACSSENNYMFRLNGTMTPNWNGPTAVNSPTGNHTFVSSWVPSPGSIYAPTTNAGPINLNILASSATITPSSFNFGSIPPEGTTSAAQQFTITNTGTAYIVPANDPSAIIPGGNASGFWLNYNGCSVEIVGELAPGESCNIEVVFYPSAAGNYSNTLTWMSSAANPLTATLTGTSSPSSPTQQTPVIHWNNPASITYGTALSATQLDATSTVAGSMTYSPALGTVLAPGTYTLSVTLTPTDTTDYTNATATVTLVVNPATLTVTAANASMLYGGNLPAFSDNITGYVNGDVAATAVTGSASLTTTATSASAVGSYSITAAIGTLASAKYTFLFKAGTLAIGKAQLTVLASNASITYRSAIPTLEYTITGFENGDVQATATTGAPKLTTTATDTSDVGSYPINIAKGTLAATNYTFAFADATLTITQGTPVITWNNPAAIRYGKALSGAQLDATANVPGKFVYSPAAGTILLPGTQTLTVTFTPTNTADDTTVTATVTLVVNQATLRVTARNETMTYGGTLPVFGYRITGFVNGDTEATVVTGSPALTSTASSTSPAGTYAIDVAQGTLAAANYVFEFKDGTLTIDKATLTVTAPILTITYGSPIPTLTDVISGFVNGDTQATAVTGAPVLSTTATSTSVAGTYPIDVTIGTLAAANYVFVLKDGTLTIRNATLILATPDVTITYGSPIPPLTYTLSGFVNGDTQATATTGMPTVTTTATATSSAGTYPITVGLGTLVASGYSFLFKSGTLTILKATPLLNWPTPAPIPYGMALGDAQLDATSPVAGSFTYTPVSGTVLNVGSRTLTTKFTPTDTTDYTTATATVTLVVSQASQTINFIPPPSPVSFGITAIPLVATASSGLPVSFSVVSGPATISGVSLLKITGFGTVVIAANQAGNADYAAAPQVTQTIIVNQGTVTVSLTESASTKREGQVVTFTVLVSGTGDTPTGTVEFFDGATELGTGALNAGGIATLSTSTLGVGTHNITATYEGNANYPPATSLELGFTVVEP